MKRRLFIGIKVGQDLESQVVKWRSRHKNKLNIRWTKQKNLHMTLVPPWCGENINRLIKKINNLKLKIKPFEVYFERIEFGPGSKRPRLIWAVGKKPKEIDYLEKYLAELFRKKPQRESDFIHLTLARFNPGDFRKFSVKKIEDKINWRDKVDSICLFESKLSKHGSDYRVLYTLKI